MLFFHKVEWRETGTQKINVTLLTIDTPINFNLKKNSFSQSKGSPLPLPIIFRYLRGLYFNKCFMCYFHSLQTLSSTQSNNYSFDYKVSYHVSHWDDRNENLLISTLRIPENSHSASHWVPLPFQVLKFQLVGRG